jgi:hypothetical protein
MEKIKDLAATTPRAWGDIAEKIDDNFAELENSIAEGNDVGDLSGFVSTTKQDFSDTQKSQARENIGAVGSDFVISVFEELKSLILNGKTDEAIAILDNAILDLSILN